MPLTPKQADTGRRRSSRSIRRSEGGRAPDQAPEASSVSLPSWRAQVQQLEHAMDEELRDALGRATLLLTDQVRQASVRLHSPVAALSRQSMPLLQLAQAACVQLHAIPCALGSHVRLEKQDGWADSVCLQAQHGRPSSALRSWDSRMGSSHSMRASNARRLGKRAVALEPHIQQCCCTAASEVADDLQQRLAQLPAVRAEEADAQTIEQALLIGRSQVQGPPMTDWARPSSTPLFSM